ncbi:RNA-processing protein [Candidatus Woesearchaeota archaeon]|jgi:ribosomal RNA assembly protein|nr:RNA-processing protein [Candidatus Woesearchaeota archaeon]MBT3438753.1 RNA-processing protein [Candidatus Woesearchaeota archaeon]MBT4058450.1 RNA-processing protein [Candidatus Woesearchaeota archaeon]MBT4208761.1 RNA-processing protein [Candidatus Woesearchaeota archaeon]MBT4733150.1 RNA-processing protein [Candidatus Woesearchaeota archaeon]
MYSQEIKIPQKRIAVLIGKKGETKKLLERKTKTTIHVTKEGEVTITSEDNINSFNAQPIVTAIARGFNPDIALMLLDESFGFELISIKQFSRNDKDLLRIRSRIIGTDGTARKMLETLTETFISVYGKTVAIIGKTENIDLSKRAIEKLLGGAPHGNVYQFIEMQKKSDLI